MRSVNLQQQTLAALNIVHKGALHYVSSISVTLDVCFKNHLCAAVMPIQNMCKSLRAW